MHLVEFQSGDFHLVENPSQCVSLKFDHGLTKALTVNDAISERIAMLMSDVQVHKSHASANWDLATKRMMKCRELEEAIAEIKSEHAKNTVDVKQENDSLRFSVNILKKIRLENEQLISDLRVRLGSVNKKLGDANAKLKLSVKKPSKNAKPAAKSLVSKPDGVLM